MFENYLKIKQKEISDLIRKKKYIKAMKILKEVHNELKLDNDELFYKFFGELLWEYPNLFEKKKFIRDYFSEIGYILTPEQAYKMEAYIIDNYCTYQGEEVLMSFYGQFYANKMLYTGRIHITSFRLFVFGSKQEESLGIFIFNPSIPPFGPAIIEGLIRSSIRKRIKKQGADLMSKYRSGKELPSFGYQFPLIEAEIIAGDDNIEITCHYELEKYDNFQRMYLENIKFKMGLYPRKLKDESAPEMAERMKIIASTLPGVLL